MTITNEQLRLEALRLAVKFCAPVKDTLSCDVLDIAEEFFCYTRNGAV
jgi:hypothetical protein